MAMKTMSWMLFTCLVVMNIINFVNHRARASKFQFTKNESELKSHQTELEATTTVQTQNGLDNNSFKQDQIENETKGDEDGETIEEVSSDNNPICSDEKNDSIAPSFTDSDSDLRTSDSSVNKNKIN